MMRLAGRRLQLELIGQRERHWPAGASKVSETALPRRRHGQLALDRQRLPVRADRRQQPPATVPMASIGRAPGARPSRRGRASSVHAGRVADERALRVGQRRHVRVGAERLQRAARQAGPRPASWEPAGGIGRMTKWPPPGSSRRSMTSPTSVLLRTLTDDRLGVLRTRHDQVPGRALGLVEAEHARRRCCSTRRHRRAARPLTSVLPVA